MMCAGTHNRKEDEHMAYLQKHRDGFVALVLAVVVCLISVAVCGSNHPWGDDYAAYILEGQAIANGTLDQQIKDNVLLHPAEFYSADLNAQTELVYVWGLPLVLSVIYKLFGSSRTLVEMFFLYKLVNCVSLGILAGASYWFYAKRMNRKLSFVLTVMLLTIFIPEINLIGTDVPFASFCLLCCCLYERWQEKKNPVLSGVVLGLCMWYLYTLRLNGIGIVIWLVLRHLCNAIRRGPKARDLVPFAVFGALWAAGRLLMPVPTSNMNDLTTPAMWSVEYYIMHFGNWITKIVPHRWLPLCVVYSAAVVICGFWGLVCRGHYRKEFGNYVLMVGSVIGAMTIPYGQGLRYVLFILPQVVLCIGFGAEDLGARISSLLKRWGVRPVCITAVGILISLGIVATNAQTVYAAWQQNVADPTDAYTFGFTDDSQDIYRYISENTPEDAVFAFGKSRTLALATGRLAFNPWANHRQMLDADYFLMDTIDLYFHIDPTEEEARHLTLVYENNSFRLYAIASEA